MNEPDAASGLNPYQSPAHSESVDPRKDSPRFRWSAVLLGWLVDVGGSMILGTVLGVVLAMQALAKNPRVTPGEFVQLATNQPLWFLLASFGLGMLCTLAGGYVTAWLAKHFIWKHVLAMGLLSTGLSILGLLANAAMGAMPAWWQFPTPLLAIPAAFLGGWIRVATRRSTTI